MSYTIVAIFRHLDKIHCRTTGFSFFPFNHWQMQFKNIFPKSARKGNLTPYPVSLRDLIKLHFISLLEHTDLQRFEYTAPFGCVLISFLFVAFNPTLYQPTERKQLWLWKSKGRGATLSGSYKAARKQRHRIRVEIPDCFYFGGCFFGLKDMLFSRK